MKPILSRDESELKARPYYRYNDAPPESSDPFAKEIPYSLLSAEHIRDYVSETGLVYPFIIAGGRRSRLKDAAYEGRIGDVAFLYEPEKTKPSQIFAKGDKFLRVPKNSIVFVECDLEFRLPEFIALRFNLQIKHVHRGLLLGTGPLVDPGYWGKLCIPLHNLTDEDYVIDVEDGLIWLEFTKTTSNLSPSDQRIGRPPLGKEFWDIREFLAKATAPLNGDYYPVGIRSAIPSMFEASASAASLAKKSSEEARNSASKSESTIKNFTFWGSIGGGLALLSLVISLVALSWNYYSDMDTQLREVRPSIEELKKNLRAAELELTQASTEAASMLEELAATQEDLEVAKTRIQKLESSFALTAQDGAIAVGSEAAGTSVAE